MVFPGNATGRTIDEAGAICKSLAPEPAVSTALAANVSVTAGRNGRRESNCLAPTLAMGGYGRRLGGRDVVLI